MAETNLTLRRRDVPLCPDCVYRSGDEQYFKLIKHNQYYCTYKDVLVQCKTKCTHNRNRFLVEKREKEKPQVPTDTKALIDKLEELMLCQAFDHVSGTITLHTSYSHMSDIKLHLGPPKTNRQEYICAHCLHQGPLVADLVDIDKLYCEHCCKHTEPYYNDEV